MAQLDTYAQVRQRASMPKRATLNVSLTPELIGIVAARVANGRHGSASEVIRAALRLLERQEDAAVSASLSPEAASTAMQQSRPSKPRR